jgi:hypothetical protein
MSMQDALQNRNDELQRREELKKNEILQSVIKKDLIEESLARLIVSKNLPHNAVEWPELRTLMCVCNPAVEKVLINSHSTVPKLIERAYNSRSVEIKNIALDTPHQIHIMLDVWTGPNRRQYLAICIQFVNRDGQLTKYTIGLPELESKSGDAQSAALILALQEWEIYTKLGYIVGDNDKTNDVLCRNIERWLRSQGITNWKASQRRIRCQGHVINLIVQAFLFCKDNAAVDEAIKRFKEAAPEADLEDILAEYWVDVASSTWRDIGPLGKLHNFAKWLRASSSRFKPFLTLAGRMIPMDNDTRWNSWFYMLMVALKVKDAVNKTIERHYDELKDDFISPTDWKTLEDTYNYLEPFEEATKVCEGDLATLDKTLYTIDFLQSHLEQSMASA